MKIILHYILTVFLVIFFDLFWLGFIAKSLYNKIMGHLLTDNIVWPAAILFYLLFSLGIIVFVVNPALQINSIKYAAIYGALFGFFTYMTYELTNMAIIKNWKWAIIPIDIVWGVVFVTIVSILSFFIAQKIN